jgi:hypothetical protein
LGDAFDELDPLMQELADKEGVFTTLLYEEQNPQIKSSLSISFFQIGAGMLATALSVSYISRHLLNDWREFTNSTSPTFWLSTLAFLKLAGSMSQLYKTCEPEWKKASQIYAKKHEDNCFVLDFSKAIIAIQKIIKIVENCPTLANTFTILIDFDSQVKIDAELSETIVRLNSTSYVAKDSSSLCEEIRSYTHYFKVLYRCLARLDAYLAVIRIYRDLEERGQAVCLVSFDLNLERPAFSFVGLRNPLVDNAIPNDFNLNGHAVLSGPSLSGKTAAMMSIASAFVMAQSILLVYAKDALIRPVDNIFINLNSNLAKLLESSKKIQGKTLLFLDEPQKGITHGEELIKDLTTELLSLPNAAFLITTNYKSPTKLAETNSLVHNWQLVVEEKDDKFKRVFCVKEGVSNWWFNDVEKVKKYILQICNE